MTGGGPLTEVDSAAGVACLHPGGLELTERLLEAAALPVGAEVLDVGCGAGATVVLLADVHRLRATGLDVAAERIVQASEARPDLDFVAGRAETLPFPADSFDAVLCECMLSTLADPGSSLFEMARVVRPGGAVLVSDVYVRAGAEAAGGSAIAALGTRPAVEALFAAAGLRVTAWTDESGALGRYLWDLAGERAPAAAPAPERRAVPGARRLGYFACVAHFPVVAKGAADA